MREAHKTAIAAARSAGTIIDFDPNLRFPLWPDRDALRRTVLEFPCRWPMWSKSRTKSWNF